MKLRMYRVLVGWRDPLGNDPDEIIESALKLRTTADWLVRMDKEGIPSSAVNSVRELMQSPEMEKCGQLTALDGMNGFKVVAAPFRIDGTRFVVSRRSEQLGESTEWFARVCREAGSYGT